MKTATVNANEAVSAIRIVARAIDRAGATWMTPRHRTSPWPRGRAARRIRRLPRPRVVEQSLHAKSAAPLQNSAGAINVNVLIEIGRDTLGRKDHRVATPNRLPVDEATGRQ